jgi:hypothetical protein
MSVLAGPRKQESKVLCCVIWKVQDVTDSCLICSVVLCIESLLFTIGREGRRKREK